MGEMAEGEAENWEALANCLFLCGFRVPGFGLREKKHEATAPHFSVWFILNCVLMKSWGRYGLKWQVGIKWKEKTKIELHIACVNYILNYLLLERKDLIMLMHF